MTEVDNSESSKKKETNQISVNHENKSLKTAIFLVNMGAPVSELGMRVFLKRMFRDKAIIDAPGPVRFLLSMLISRTRYKSSWKKYLKIGGSPLMNSMNRTAAELRKVLSDEYIVANAYSYSEPFIENEISEFVTEGFTDFVVISMYPQASFSTTGSVKAILDKIQENHPDIHIRFVEDYHDHALFLQFWTNLISQKITETGYKKPYLLFSSHAIPQSYVERGDSYTLKIEKSAQLIASALDLPYSVSYQSKIGPTRWTRPATADQLKKLKESKVNEIMVVPLSFMNENLETRYDLDEELIPYARKTLNIKEICRINIPETDKTLLRLYQSFAEYSIPE